jgi:hypothetical protein
MTTTFKAIATKGDVKSSAIYALKCGVNVRKVREQLKEHNIIIDAKMRNEIINLLMEQV